MGATITTLGFNIISRYNGRGMRAARRDVNSFDNDVRRTNSSMSAFGGRMGLMTTAALALGPAMLQVGTVAVGVAGAFAAAGLAAGAAGGLFAAMAITAVKHWKHMGVEGRRFHGQMILLRNTWFKFITDNKRFSLRPMIDVMDGARVAIGKLQPIVNAMGPSFIRLGQATRKWLSGAGMDRFVRTIVAQGVPAMKNLLVVMRNLAAVFGFAFRAFAPLGTEMTAGLARLSGILRNWAAGGGFDRFVQRLRKNLPGAKAFVIALWGAFKALAGGLMLLGPASLSGLTILLRLIGRMSPQTVRNLAIAFLALRASMLALAGAEKVIGTMTRLQVVMGRLGGAGRAGSIGAVSGGASGLIPRLASMGSKGGIAAAGLVLLAGALFLAWKHSAFFRSALSALGNAFAQLVTALTGGHVHVKNFTAALAFLGKVIGIVYGLFFGSLIFAITGLVKATTFAVRFIIFYWTTLFHVTMTVFNAMRVATVVTVGAIVRGFRIMGIAIATGFVAAWRFAGRVVQAVGAGIRLSWGFVSRAVVAAFHFVANGVRGFFLTAWRVAGRVVQAVGAGIRLSWGFVSRAVVAAFHFVANGVRGFFVAAWRLGGRIVHAVATGMRVTFSFASRAIMAAAHFIANGIRGFLAAAWHLILRIVQTVSHGARVAVTAMKNGIITSFRFVAGAIKGWVKAAWDLLVKVVRAVSHAARVAITAMKNGIVSSFRFLVGAIRGWVKGGWDFFLKVVRNVGLAVMHAMTRMKNGVIASFRLAVEGVKKAWGWLKTITKAPVNFVINTVYNKGIRNLWNKVAGIIFGNGKKSLPKIAGLATGGHVKGPGGSTADKVPAMLSAGEHVWTAAEVKAAGGHQAMMALRSMAMKGKAVSSGPKHANHGPRPGYALGGIIPTPGDILDKVQDIAGGVAKGAMGVINKIPGIKNLVRGALGKIADPILGGMKKLVRGAIGTKPPWRGLVAEGAVQPIDWIQGFIDADDASFMSGNGYTPWAPWRAGDGRRISYHGKAMNVRTKAMLQHAETMSKILFSVPQGSWSNGGKSAGTHTGGGVIDTLPAKDKHVGSLRASGFAAWRRTPKEGFSPHIHSVAVGDHQLSGPAQKQVKAFFAGRNGLANNGPDTYGGGGAGGSGKWKGLVMSVLKDLGLPLSNTANVLKAIQKESGGNPKAINLTDSNARAGHPSKGLLQVIQSTFNRYAGHTKPWGIYHPYANVYAGINYAHHRYGGGWSARMARPGGYAKGGAVFDNGGTLAPGWNSIYNGTGGPEPLVRADRAEGNQYHVHVHGNVYTKSEAEFQSMLAHSLQELKRKNRLPK